MKRLLLGLAFVLLAAQVHAVPLRSLGNLTPTNPEVPSPKFSGTYSQMLSEPATLLQGGDTWDTTDTQAEYIWNLPAQTWVFSLSFAVPPTPTITNTPAPTNTFTSTPTGSWTFIYTPTPTFTPTFTATPTGSWTPIIPVNADIPQGMISNGNLSNITKSKYAVDSFGLEEGLNANFADNPSIGFGSLYGTSAYFGFGDTTYSEIVLGNHILIEFGGYPWNGGYPYTWFFDPADGGLNAEAHPLDNISLITTQNAFIQNAVTVYSTPGVISSPVPGVTGLSVDGSAFTMGIRTSFGPTPTPGTSGLVTTSTQNLLFVGGAYAGGSASPTPTPNILSGFVTLANDLTPVAVSNTNFSANTRMVVTAKNSVTGVVNSFGVTCISGACSIVGTATGAVTAMWIAQP